MTPQLQQAIKLLQLSNLELTAYVEQELEKNPLLEREEAGADGPSGEGNEAPESQAEGAISAERRLELGDDGPVTPSADSPLDADYSNDYDAGGVSDGAPSSAEYGDPATSLRYRESGGGGSFDSPDYDFDNVLVPEETLHSHLMDQLAIEIAEPRMRLVAAYIIDLVNEAGYLLESEAAIADRLGCPESFVEEAIARLQRLDPVGCFARSLSECLKLQLMELNRFDPAMEALLDNLELLARGDYAELKRTCGVDAEDLTEMVAEIRSLNPKPGLKYSSDVAQTVVPDVFVRPHMEGGWSVELNTDTLPKVLVNNRYHAAITGKACSKEDKAYLSDCMNTANWLVKSLDQRANTILRVSSELVRQQESFLTHGVEYLRPLNLRTVAEAISMHESTVSRVTANKYMATPRGIFELKYFFTSAIPSADGGEAYSAEAVRQRIKTLIENEDADQVLSDDRIVDILRDSGIDIARRTVAKYREALRIPSSVQRRRTKKQFA